MTSGTAELGKNPFAGGRERASRASAHPGFILSGLHDLLRADHAGVLGTAILGAEQVVAARLSRTEPGDRVASRHHVLLHAELRNEEAVDHILRSQDQLD